MKKKRKTEKTTGGRIRKKNKGDSVEEKYMGIVFGRDGMIMDSSLDIRKNTHFSFSRRK